MNDIDQKIAQLEEQMLEQDFWSDKVRAQNVIKEISELKLKKEGVGIYDKGGAVMTVFSGAGGDDAEDFSSMLFDMYRKYINKQGWTATLIHEHSNDHGGYRNVSFEVDGAGAYGSLKNESGVHRLVRISPFNAKNLRHTSFSMVEVIPKFHKSLNIDVSPSDLRFELSKAGGPGGQNVNKRETAVRVVHIPTNIAVHVSSERSQAQNKEKAIELLKSKLFKKQQDEEKAKEKGMQISSSTDIEWGNQIRSYVLHPYKMVKDHRTDIEIRDVDKVLDGDIQEFIDAEKNL